MITAADFQKWLDIFNIKSGGGGGSGTVTQVNTGFGLFGGPITTSGTISLGLPVGGYSSIVTAAGTTTLTNTSTVEQFFTGTTTQTVLLPVTSTLVAGQEYRIVNNSTGVVTVQSSGGNTIQAMAAGTSMIVNAISLTGTTAASWSKAYFSTPTGGTVTSVTAGTGLNGGTITGSGTIGLVIPVPVANGGTGLTSIAINSLIYASAANTLAALGTFGNCVLSTDSFGVPLFSSNLPANVQDNINQLGTLAAPLNMGSNQINNIASPSASGDAANKAYVDSAVAGLAPGDAAQAAATTNFAATYNNGSSGVGATLTATSTGIVTLDGVNTVAGEIYLFPNQTAGLQNGLYLCTVQGAVGVAGVFTRISTYDTPTQINETGIIPVINGSTLAGQGFYQTAFVVAVGTTALVYVKFGNTGTVSSITAGTGLNGGTITSSGTIGLVIPVLVTSGGTGVTAVTTAPAATAWAGWDANSNMSANSFIGGFTSTPTAAGTTTLTAGSTQQQAFTGTTTQTMLLPVVSTLVAGQSFYVTNSSTGTVTVESSGANTVQALAAGTAAIFTCILTSGTTAASWQVTYIAGSSGGVTSANIQQQAFTYVLATGTANAITATFSPAVTSLTAGSKFDIKIIHSNTGATTLDVGIGPKTVVLADGSASACIGGELVTTQIASFEYDGTNFQLLNPSNVVYTNGVRSVFGQGAVRSGNDALAIGLNANAGSSSIAVGQSSSATGNNAVAFGNGTQANHNNAIAMGGGGQADANGAVVIGQGNPFAGGVGSYALGDGASVSGAHSYGLGLNAATTFAGSFVFCDSNGAPVNDTAANQWQMTFAGGYFFNEARGTLWANINGNGVQGFSVTPGYTTAVTAAGTTTLTVASNQQQWFTGTTTQTVVLPVTSTLILGQSYEIVNNSTGAVTVQSSGGNNIAVVSGGTTAIISCVLLTGTTAASWSVRSIAVNAGGSGATITSTVASGSAVSCTSGAATDITSILVPAGTWAVYGNVNSAAPSAALDYLYGWTSTTSATLPDASLYAAANNSANSGNSVGVATPMAVHVLTTPTTIYLSARQHDSGGSSQTVCGGITAVLVR